MVASQPCDQLTMCAWPFCYCGSGNPPRYNGKFVMTPKQYIDAIDRLGLSQRSAGRFLGVDERQSRRWVAGDSAIPESVAKLLRLMVRLKLDPEDVK
jgi:hypothetical protein